MIADSLMVLNVVFTTCLLTERKSRFAASKTYLQRTHCSHVNKSVSSLLQKCKRDDALRQKVLALTEDAEITRSISWFRKDVPLLAKCSFDHTVWNKCRLSQKRCTFINPSWCKEVLITLLQPLQWCCVDCVIHHERDVREEQHHHMCSASKQ